MIDDDIDDCACERLADNFTALRTGYQEHHERAYNYYRNVIFDDVDVSWVPPSPRPDLLNDEPPFVCFSLRFGRLRLRCWKWIVALQPVIGNVYLPQ
jgi:hypothetical protein